MEPIKSTRKSSSRSRTKRSKSRSASVKSSSVKIDADDGKIQKPKHTEGNSAQDKIQKWFYNCSDQSFIALVILSVMCILVAVLVGFSLVALIALIGKDRNTISAVGSDFARPYQRGKWSYCDRLKFPNFIGSVSSITRLGPIQWHNKSLPGSNETLNHIYMSWTGTGPRDYVFTWWQPHWSSPVPLWHSLAEIRYDDGNNQNRNYTPYVSQSKPDVFFVFEDRVYMIEQNSGNMSSLPLPKLFDYEMVAFRSADANLLRHWLQNTPEDNPHHNATTWLRQIVKAAGYSPENKDLQLVSLTEIDPNRNLYYAELKDRDKFTSLVVVYTGDLIDDTLRNDQDSPSTNRIFSVGKNLTGGTEFLLYNLFQGTDGQILQPFTHHLHDPYTKKLPDESDVAPTKMTSFPGISVNYFLGCPPDLCIDPRPDAVVSIDSSVTQWIVGRHYIDINRKTATDNRYEAIAYFHEYIYIGCAFEVTDYFTVYVGIKSRRLTRHQASYTPVRNHFANTYTLKSSQNDHKWPDGLVWPEAAHFIRALNVFRHDVIRTKKGLTGLLIVWDAAFGYSVSCWEVYVDKATDSEGVNQIRYVPIGSAEPFRKWTLATKRPEILNGHLDAAHQAEPVIREKSAIYLFNGNYFYEMPDYKYLLTRSAAKELSVNLDTLNWDAVHMWHILDPQGPISKPKIDKEKRKYDWLNCVGKATPRIEDEPPEGLDKFCDKYHRAELPLCRGEIGPAPNFTTYPGDDLDNKTGPYLIGQGVDDDPGAPIPSPPRPGPPPRSPSDAFSKVVVVLLIVICVGGTVLIFLIKYLIELARHRQGLARQPPRIHNFTSIAEGGVSTHSDYTTARIPKSIKD